ncbi:hypothetical protein DICVIV_12432 [Dictyocaulus viviparus]|uniref:Uncharacterized protein n=1 Tax=Dictyocaulus viviparus TaxID=29172 RepID=A0A0D8XGV6_DICVI|nr:hypothetical protein DICVIV_12432 [Dictyocaulus viviparus]
MLFLLSINDASAMHHLLTYSCHIMSGTVTKICTITVMVNVGGVQMPTCPMGKLNAVDQMYLTISGSITTTNIIMANWSTQRWQIVLNRGLQSLTSRALSS